MDIHLLRKEQRLGSGEVEHGGGGVGGERGPLLMGRVGVGSKIFGNLLGTEINNSWSRGRIIYFVQHIRGGWWMGEGFRTLLSVFMKNVSASLEGAVPQTSHYCYNFRLFSLQLKDIHKNNYRSIPDYFLSKKYTWGIHIHQKINK